VSGLNICGHGCSRFCSDYFCFLTYCQAVLLVMAFLALSCLINASEMKEVMEMPCLDRGCYIDAVQELLDILASSNALDASSQWSAACLLIWPGAPQVTVNCLPDVAAKRLQLLYEAVKDCVDAAEDTDNIWVRATNFLTCAVAADESDDEGN
jgi:hypothetical protein